MRVPKLLLLGTCLTLPEISLAQQGKGGRPGSDPWSKIALHDKDGDGKVTSEEFGGPEHVFTRFDANKDSSLTKEEVSAARTKGGGKRGGQRSAKPDDAPKVGDTPPKVSALKLRSDEQVDLSNPNKITVLVFGSHT